MNNHTFIFLGATGNLAKLKIYPALSRLSEEENGSTDAGSISQLICTAYEDINADEFRDKIRNHYQISFNNTDYVKTDLLNDDFSIIADRIQNKEDYIIIYLCTSPSLFLKAITDICSCNALSMEKVKILLEKPYGTDYEDTVRINEYIRENLSENQVYRVDHYLGKEGFEVLNGVKEKYRDKWNDRYIEHITVILSETVGIEERKDFYRETGAISDVVQNHMFQMLLKAITDSSYPEERAIEDISEAFNKGQAEFRYMQYLDFEKETMVYGEINTGSDKWKNTRFRLLTGKRMTEKRTEIRIKFKDTNEPVIVDFTRANTNADSLPEYSKLINSCINKDHSNFVSSREAEATWKFGNSIRESCKNEDICKYEPDTISTEDVLVWLDEMKYTEKPE